MKLLAISTSTPRGSVALFDLDPSSVPAPAARPRAEEERLLASVVYADVAGHAERLFAAIDEALDAASTAREAIGAIGCDVGPGSFTGVRVAVAAAKGIALALGIPAVGVCSLEAMADAAFADGAAAEGDLLVPLLDAKKGEVFLAAFDAPAAPPLLSPRHDRRDEALAAISPVGATRRVVVVGEVAEEIATLRPLRAHGASLDLPDAAWIGRVAARRLRACARRAAAEPGAEHAGIEAEHGAHRLEPLYVRAPDAKPVELGYTPPR